MRTLGSAICVALLLALALGVVAHAGGGGNGATKVGLFVAYYPDGVIPSVIVEPEQAVGKVIYHTTGKGEMHAVIQLKNGLPSTTYQAFVVPTAIWGSTTAQGYALTTNKRGKGVLHIIRDIPEDADDPVSITAILRTGSPADPATVVYRTPEALVDLK